MPHGFTDGATVTPSLNLKQRTSPHNALGSDIPNQSVSRDTRRLHDLFLLPATVGNASVS